MSQNLNQVFMANPITSNASTDLIYFMQSPYTAGTDAGMTYANFAAQFGAPYTAAALTSTSDTNVTITLGGTPATALLHAASITMGWTGTLAVGRGGLGISSTPTNGQIPIGNGTNYTAATITAGTGISVTNGSGTITIAAATSGMTWTTVSGTTQAASVNNGYVANNAGAVTVTLPATAAVGDEVAVEGLGAGGWVLTANTGQTIKIGSATTSSAGSLTSAAATDNVYVTCIVANTTWRVRTTNSAGLTTS